MGFKSVGALLAWAFEESSETKGASSSLGAASESNGGVNPLEGLSTFERRGLAAQVVTWASTLPLGEKLIILGMFGPPVSQATVAFGLVGIVPAHYGIPSASLAIRRWFDGRITKQMLAEKMNRSVRTADTYFGDVADALDGLRRSAYRMARQRFSSVLDDPDFHLIPGRFEMQGVDRMNCALAS